tara:strand:+ start:22263 stop:23123 length:861 start_codon:yes stop_codon:yes gene_type:complete
MSNYFSYLPEVYVRTTSYRQNNVDPYSLAKNIFRRIKIREDLSDIIMGFSQYTIKNNQRPDQVAYDFYGDMQYDWVVLLCNNILNVYDEWPMTEDELERYIDSEYESPDSVHHWVTQKIRDTKGRVLIKPGMEVPENWAYTRPDGTVVGKADTVRPISVYDYESERNNYKRNIYLLRKQYLGGFVEEFKNLVDYLPNSETNEETNAKKSKNTVQEQFVTVKEAYVTNIGLDSTIDFASEQDYSSRTFDTSAATIGEGQTLSDSSVTVTTSTTNDSPTTTSNQYGSG